MGLLSQVFPLGWPRRESAGMDLWSPIWLYTPKVRQVARIGEGQQIGAISHRAALPPLLPFEETPVVDADLRFVASLHIEGLRTLRDWRRRAVGAEPAPQAHPPLCHHPELR